MKKHRNLFWFTLVELIVVITIVWILSTVWFVSYSGYLTWARDSNRVSQLTKLSDSLQVYAASKTLPLPDDYIDITASWTVIAYQWYVWVDVLETIDYTNWGRDPKDDSYYTYYLTKDRKSLQLMAMMEEQQSIALKPIWEINANYEDRYPKVFGRKLWVLTYSDDIDPSLANTPVQEVPAISWVWELDIVLTDTVFTANITDAPFDKITWTWASLASVNQNASCKRIKQTGWAWNSWIYTISPIWEDLQVYCEMDIQWGGWTLVARSVVWWTSMILWNSAWNVTDNTSVYVLWDFSDLSYKESLLSSYTRAKNIDESKTDDTVPLTLSFDGTHGLDADGITGWATDDWFFWEQGMLFVK